MFMGSAHVKYGEWDSWLEAAGGENNASTDFDRTNYYINVPSNAVELALYLESDRMGYLLDAMTPQTVDAQREVVINERPQQPDAARVAAANAPAGAAVRVLGAGRVTGWINVPADQAGDAGPVHLHAARPAAR